MAKRVTAIPPTISRFTAAPINSQKKRRVAGYARVSTDHEDQQSSYEAQVDYYTTYIKGRDDWEFAGMYADEGISATNTRHRDGFNNMVADALDGKIDLIITKSVSRFARNTVDSLTTVRKLKEKGVEVYFEKENIWTLDAKGELLITIMSSLAQEESRSISENTTWGQRKRFADGKVSVPYSHFLGYERGPDGNLVINPEQAESVRLIYSLFLSGLSLHSVASEMTKRGIKTPAGKDKWSQTTVKSILTNEKYKGDALLQKNYTVDFLTKKQKKNEGQVPQYYVENNHEAIITPQQFEQVQAELLRRSKSKGKYSGVSLFSNKIKCGQCGSWYGSKVWHSTDKYRKVIYRCNHKFDKDKLCDTPHFTEDEIKQMFIKGINKLVEDRDSVIEALEETIPLLCGNEELLRQQSELSDEMGVLVEMTQTAVAENARIALDQTEYQKRYDGLVNRYDAAKAKYDVVTEQIADRNAKQEILTSFLDTLRKVDGAVSEFDEVLWSSTVDFITVFSSKDIRITFKGGIEIQL